MLVMELFGMLPPEDVQAGIRLVLDEKYYVNLLAGGKVIATFDPRDYTAAELRAEVSDRLHPRSPAGSSPSARPARGRDPDDD